MNKKLERAVSAAEVYETIKGKYSAFCLHCAATLHLNKYLKTLYEVTSDYILAKLFFLDATFNIRLSIVPLRDKFYGVVCIYLAEYNNETPLLKYFVDIYGNVLDSLTSTSSGYNISEKQFVDIFIGDISEAYLNLLEIRHKT